MTRAALADAFEWDGSLLNLWSFGTEAPAWDRAMRALDAAFPCVFRLNGEPAPLLGPDEIQRWAGGEEGTAEFYADTACAAGSTGLEVVFILNFGVDPMQATLHPLDVPDEAAFLRLTHLLSILTEATGWDVSLCAESGEFESHLVYAVYRSGSGWMLDPNRAGGL